MKKIFVVSIVFAITSLSPAGLILDGPETIEQGGTVNMAILGDNPFDFVGTVWVNKSTDNAVGDALSNVIIIPKPPFPPYCLPPDFPGLPDSFTFGLDYPVGFFPLPDIPRVTFDLTNSGTPLGGTITIDFMDLTSGAVSTHNIEVVPEPASMLLLGLGAMMLRRRK